MTTIKIHNAETGQIIERDMTADELAQWEIQQEEGLKSYEAALLKRQQRTELLERLGITEEDAKILLG